MKKNIIWLQALLVCSVCGLLLERNALSADNKFLEQVFVDLKVEQKTVSEVLVEIEKKTGYKIDTDKPLQGTVTFEFKHISLQESIDRLFSGVNHSIIFNDQEKKITVLTFDERGKSLDPKTGLSNNKIKRDNLSIQGSSPMANSSLTIDAQKEKMKSGVKQESQPENSPMSASDKAIKERMKTGVKQESQPENSPMSASDKAIKEMMKTGVKQASQPENSPMSASDKAIKEMRKTGVKQESQPEKSPMSASDKAMDAFAKKKNK